MGDEILRREKPADQIRDDYGFKMTFNRQVAKNAKKLLRKNLGVLCVLAVHIFQEYFMKALITLTIVVLIVAGCGGAPAPTATVPAPVATESAAVEATYQTITIDQFADIVENQSDEYAIVNVHIPYEGEVANTDQHIDYRDITALTAALPDKNAPIVLYCRSGRMSEEASRELVALGYTNVLDVPGGMVAWQSSGREIITK
jgi:phage shock protein E